MFIPDPFPYHPQLPWCLGGSVGSNPRAMHAHGGPGGGRGQEDPHPSNQISPAPPQVLFFGEFSHKLAPGQRPTEGGEVDEVRAA